MKEKSSYRKYGHSITFDRRVLLALVVGVVALISMNIQAGELEKEDLKFGFTKLTDMAPLAIAYEKRVF